MVAGGSTGGPFDPNPKRNDTDSFQQTVDRAVYTKIALEGPVSEKDLNNLGYSPVEVSASLERCKNRGEIKELGESSGSVLWDIVEHQAAVRTKAEFPVGLMILVLVVTALMLAAVIYWWRA